MKNIVLLSDGTGNSAAKQHKTNVWRLYEALNLSDPDKQIAFYNDGVGSQEFLPLKLLGSAFGWGLARNVTELYTALCRTYEGGDKIYLFGFSRGAFTIRMLAGLINQCGLAKADDEGELRRTAHRHLNTYRSQYQRGYLYRLVQCVRHRLVQCVRRLLQRSDAKSDDRNEVRIEFIGAWDTVDAYGFPVYELVSLWDRLVWPLRFVNRTPSANVQRACHALSIDDERASFSPMLWDEKCGRDSKEQSEADHAERNGDNGDENENPPRIEQVWFAGVHADVGGGYPRNALALVTLDWMISKVEATEQGTGGLYFISTIRDQYNRRANCHGVQHDSRAGLGAYYRYSPRDIGQLCKDNGIDTPRVHWSTLKRIQNGIVTYAPTALPATYEVVDSRGKKTNQYKCYDKEKMNAARADIQWRRWLYRGFVLATLTTLTPALLPLFHSGTCGNSCDGWFFWMEAWIDVVQNPFWAAAIVVVAVILASFKAILYRATREHAAAAWAELKKGD